MINGFEERSQLRPIAQAPGFGGAASTTRTPPLPGSSVDALREELRWQVEVAAWAALDTAARMVI
jgi:hypothetical protein